MQICQSLAPLAHPLNSCFEQESKGPTEENYQHILIPTEENYQHILIPRKDSQHIAELDLDAMMTAEHTGQPGDYKCDKCSTKNKSTERTMVFVDTPDVLILHLKRFAYGDGASKIDTAVTDPTTKSLTIDVDGGSSVTYEPYAMVVHNGGDVKFGHFWAAVKSGDTWHSVDDSRVAKLDMSDDGTRKLVQEGCYVLFFRRT
jgi:ubiquitin C-terminal hydrolase